MKDLKVYYQTDDAADSIDSVFDEFVEIVAKHLGLKFMGAGVTVSTGVRDLHYKKEKK